MKTSKITDSQIMSILKQAESGTLVATLWREYDMSNAIFYKWRAKYGGMDTSLIELEAMSVISETCYRYQAKLSDDNTFIAEQLIELTEENPDWSFGLCFSYLQHVKSHC